MFALGDTSRQLSILFLLACFRSNCADEILIQTFRNVGANGSVPNVILQQLNRTDKLQCCLRCIERSGCLMLGVLPQRKCLLLGDHAEGTRNQSVIEEDEYVIYSYSSVTTSTPTMYTTSPVTSPTSHPPATKTTISDSTVTNSSTTLPSPSYTTNPDTTVTTSSTTTPSSTNTARPGTNVTPSTPTGENTTTIFDPNDPYIKSKYTVITQTGTDPDSETECIVHLKLFGENGLLRSLYLDHPGREMTRGANDTFTFHGSKNLGKVTRLQLQVSQYGLKGGWFVIGVEVKRERVHQHYRHFDSYYSYLNKWFQSLELGLSLITSFLPTSQYIDFKLTSDYFEKL